jgi:hypothetical protein
MTIANVDSIPPGNEYVNEIPPTLAIASDSIMISAAGETAIVDLSASLTKWRPAH